MTLIKTSLLNGIAVVIKMLTLLGLNKILAIYVGPSGYAALGQFQNAVQMITTLASGAISTGVTKYTAEYHDDELKQQTLWCTAGTIALIGSLLVAALVTLFNRSLAVWFLNDEDLGGVFVWFAATIILFVFNALLLAVLNGKKEVRSYVAASIAGSLFAFVITTIMATQLGLYGALVSLAIYQSLAFFVTLFICKKARWFKVKYFFGYIDRQAAKNLAKFTAMALTSAICIPISHVMIRNHLNENFGWEYAGYWEAMWRLSSAYLMLATSTLAVYYLPRFSELKDSACIRRELVRGYMFVLPVAMVAAILIYSLRDVLIIHLFSDEFKGMSVLFGWQVLGDILKIGSWILGAVVIAKAFVGIYIFSEIFSSVLFYVLTKSLSEFMGFEAVSFAHAVNYSLHFVLLFFLLNRNNAL